MEKECKILMLCLIMTLLLGSICGAQQGDEVTAPPAERGVAAVPKEQRLARHEAEQFQRQRQELMEHRRELAGRAHDLERELQGLRDDQDEEARQLQAELREIRQRMREIQQELRGDESRHWPETEELECLLPPAPAYRQMLRQPEHIKRMHHELAELKEAAANAKRQGRHDEAAELHEKASRLAEEIKMLAAKQRIEWLRHAAAQAKEQGEMEKSRDLRAQAEQLQARLNYELKKRELKGPKPWREGPMGRPELPLSAEQFEHMQRQLYDILAPHLDRMEGAIKHLTMRLERMERALRELHAENEQLKRELRERGRGRAPRQRRAGREPGERSERRERRLRVNRGERDRGREEIRD